MFFLTRPLLNEVPKKRATRWWTRRRHLLQYVDHYRNLWKPRREHYDRRRYQAPMYEEKYTAPNFRYPGFWPGQFGFERTSAAQQAIANPTPAASTTPAAKS
eukprot:CAMPEP_0194752298 /NCGR_PEP_ID=MMETSP0323_2-20130528/6081_1 /TAXON_ID=2866 ORGANISM="Crypthecodinium cohnii, Strain Seligo" /NCGR_SAMPLE_ID=MMETSP0323_2 /ASSEMBLY_ACC=CAM_ASM_000346 /LENGTH=101 /DNA_ID=CAMNT_0039669099 /DNA_START=111 /DNA_END=416 /DNA_ORIENTATION=-